MHPPQPRPSVSVVLCTYNGAAYLQQQLDSIAAQTMQPLELIACDDGSTDATMEILKAFQQRASFRVEMIQNETNLGSTANFDKAMQQASGKYLALSDQDDVWLPEKLAKLVSILESDPTLGGTFSDAGILDSRAEARALSQTKTLWSLHGFSSSKQKAFASKSGAIGLLLRADVITGATLLVRTDLRTLWHPIPKSWVHDGWLAWIIALHSSFQPAPDALMLYRLHDDQQLGIGSKNFLERRKVLRQMERARYDRVAKQFEVLLEHVRSSGGDSVVEDHLRRKISLLRRRAELPHRLSHRLMFVLANAREYHLYARGWRSMRKDLFV